MRPIRTLVTVRQFSDRSDTAPMKPRIKKRRMPSVTTSALGKQVIELVTIFEKLNVLFFSDCDHFGKLKIGPLSAAQTLHVQRRRQGAPKVSSRHINLRRSAARAFLTLQFNRGANSKQRLIRFINDCL